MSDSVHYVRVHRAVYLTHISKKVYVSKRDEDGRYRVCVYVCVYNFQHGIFPPKRSEKTHYFGARIKIIPKFLFSQIEKEKGAGLMYINACRKDVLKISLVKSVGRNAQKYDTLR